MKIRPKKQTPYKKIFILLAVVLFTVGGLGTYALLNRTASDTSKLPTTKRSDRGYGSSEGVVSQDDSSSEPTSTPDSADSPERESEKELTPQYEGTSTNATPSLSGAVTYSAVAGDNLIIRTSINQHISSGTCVATLTNNTKTISKSSGIMANPSSSTCEGFDIPVSDLGAGKWGISIEVSSGDRQGTLTGEVNI